VHQKKHADGKDQHEWADEKPKVQVKITKEWVNSTSHSASPTSKRRDHHPPDVGSNYPSQIYPDACIRFPFHAKAINPGGTRTGLLPGGLWV
jgi:hypothetical protein